MSRNNSRPKKRTPPKRTFYDSDSSDTGSESDFPLQPPTKKRMPSVNYYTGDPKQILHQSEDLDETETEADSEPEAEAAEEEAPQEEEEDKEEETVLNNRGEEVNMEFAQPCKDLDGYFTCKKTTARWVDFELEEMRARVVGPKAVLKNHLCMKCCKPLNWTTCKNIMKKSREESNFAWCSPTNPANVCKQCNAHQKRSGINAMHVLCGVCWNTLDLATDHYQLTGPHMESDSHAERSNTTAPSNPSSVQA